MALATPTMPVAPVGPARRLATIVLDAVVGVVALPALWLMEAVLQVLHLVPTDVWVNNVLTALPCLLWLAILMALARRGRTPASIMTRQRWVDAAGMPVSWGPLGSLSFWIAAAPVLFTSLLFAEDLCLAGPGWSWGGWPPPFENYGPGIGAACLMIVVIALPPYVRFHRQADCVRPTPR